MIVTIAELYFLGNNNKNKYQIVKQNSSYLYLDESNINSRFLVITHYLLNNNNNRNK